MLRTERTHDDHCLQLKDEELYRHLSVNYGVNQWSILCKVLWFQSKWMSAIWCHAHTTGRCNSNGCQVWFKLDYAKLMWVFNFPHLQTTTGALSPQEVFYSCSPQSEDQRSWLGIQWQQRPSYTDMISKHTVTNDNKLGQRGIHVCHGTHYGG